MRLRFYLSLSCLFIALIGWRVSTVHRLTATPTISAQAGPNCSLVGNNLAILFGGKATGNYSEATHTLALLTGRSDIPAIVSAINSTDKTIIVRLGAGLAASGPPANDYVAILNEIAGQIGPKSFIATAGHNEPNCAEFIPLAEEVKYVQTVTQGLTASNVTLITGQIDHYCGDPALPKPQSYIDALTKIPGIKGLALPFYITEGTPDATSTVNLFNQVAATTSLPIYVTEAGPLKPGSMREFIIGVAKVLENPKIQAFLLFNALGLNPDPNFTYTKPFANPACREALRTQCQDIEAVVAVCGDTLNPDEYYLYPIAGLATKDQPVIFDDLIKQGYEAQCSTPAFYTEVAAGANLVRFKELVDQGLATVQARTVENELKIEYVTSKVPVWRDSNPVATLMSSLEDFWGFQTIEAEIEAQQLIASSPIYSLLTIEQQCEMKVHILETTQLLCEKLADPNTCALYQPINGTAGYTTKTALEGWRSSNLTCKKINQGEYKKAQKPLVTAILRTPLYLDRAYRLAFLVLSTELRNDPNPINIFDFLRKDAGEGNAYPKHEVRVIAFKIPDIGTNRADDEANYQDPLQLTRNSFLDLETIKKNKTAGIQKRDALRTPVHPPGSPPVIECGGETCSDPLIKSLLEMINNQGEQCKYKPANLRFEASNDIYSPGSLASGAGTLFKDGSNPSIDLFTTPSDQVKQPQIASYNFLSRIGLGGTGDSQAQTQAFLIYPMGYELGTVEESLLAFFDQKWGKSLDTDLPVRDYFKLTGIEQAMTEGKATVDFIDPNPTCTTDPATNLQDCTSLKTAEAGIETDFTNKQPRILGGRLGFLTRFIQRTLHEVKSRPFAFITACRTTEDFLLGRCTEKQTPGPDETTDSLTAVAQCQAGSARITSGEDAIHIPDSGNAACNKYDAGSHAIPNWKNAADPVKDCANLFSYIACTYPETLIENPVSSSGTFFNAGTLTACQYVVDQAKAAGISPRFALAMWGEESGFSAYRVPDFGVISLKSQNLGLQFTGFKGIVEDFSASEYQGFLERYSGETRGSGSFCNNKYFPGRLKVFYDYLGP